MNYLSLFSGIEAASVAWQPLGWQPVAFAEIEPFPCAVLAHHYPDVPNLGDVTEITDEQIAALGSIDVVVGGSPCQNLSVAGKRAGLAGAQSKLFHEQVRIFNAARHFCGARWLIWENVPGAFSSNQGHDFAVVVGTMAGCRLDVPLDGWGQEGVALGQHGLLEWAVLDAQWFGLAQRRKRVFAVLDTGNWQDRPPILLERDSLRGDTAPRRAAQKSAANSTHASADRARRKQAVPEIAMCLNAGAMGRQDAESETLIPAMVFQCHGGSVGEMGTLRATGNVQSGVPFTLSIHGAQDPDVLTGSAHILGCNQGQENAICITGDVTHALTCEGFDASEDGTGRGQPIVAAFQDHGQADGMSLENIVYTLTERGRDGGHALEHRSDGTANALLTPNGGRAGMGVGAIAYGPTVVRRLTPRECERLQGFPDDWTRIAWRGKPAESCPDSPRYRALGNSMAVPVMHWIGQRIDSATHVYASNPHVAFSNFQPESEHICGTY